MKNLVSIVSLVCLILLTPYLVATRTLDPSDSPVIMLPTAEIAQGMSEYVVNAFKKYYNINFVEKFPEELQGELINNSDLKFIINSNFSEIASIISYDSDPAKTIGSIQNYISNQVRTIIITKIDSKGDGEIVLKAKAINVLNNEIIVEKRINFPIAEIDNIDKKIHQLAKKMISEKKFIGFGIGFGFQTGNQLSIENIPDDLRLGVPHPDDRSRTDILPVNDPNNYFIYQNSVDVSLPHRINLDFNFRFWGIVNIAIKTSAIKDSEVIEGENLYRKSYIRENPTGGDALIYYLVRSKTRSFFDANSFSIPIFITYPVFYFGKNKNVIFHLMGGTNLLLPDKISFEAEKGWHRFNELQEETTVDLGEIKERRFLAGIDIEGMLTKSLSLDFQFNLAYINYQENFNFPLTIHQSSKVSPSYRLSLSYNLDLN